MPNLPYQYVTQTIMMTVMTNGIEWMEKGFVGGGPKNFVPASQIAEVVEDTGGLLSSAKLEIRFRGREPLALSAPLGQRGPLHELKEAIASILS